MLQKIGFLSNFPIFRLIFSYFPGEAEIRVVEARNPRSSRRAGSISLTLFLTPGAERAQGPIFGLLFEAQVIPVAREQKRHIKLFHIKLFPLTPVTGPPGRVSRQKDLCSLNSEDST